MSTLGIYLTDLGGTNTNQDHPIRLNSSLYELDKLDEVYSFVNRTGQSLDDYINNINSSKLQLPTDSEYADLLGTRQMANLDFLTLSANPSGEL